MAESDGDQYIPFSDGRIKHMEMLQSVIARLGANGFVVKGWAITLVGAFIGFAMTRDHAALAAIGVAVPAFFWFLDATYLRSEHAFRLLFERVRSEDEVEPFFMNATDPQYIKTLARSDQRKLRWRTVIWRPGLSVFYITLIASAVAATLFLALTGSSESRSPVPTNSPSEASE